MKKILLSALFISMSFSIWAQNQVVLSFNHQINDQPLISGEQYTHSVLNYDFSITRLQYYVSQIEIIHDGSQQTSIDNTWLLVNAMEDDVFDLGSHDINQVEEVRFWIGIEPETNHLDPATYPEGHPLALQNPSMHWGWASGYRFCTLEGKTGPGLILTYELHSLGDANYWQVSVPSSNLTANNEILISIDADYMGLLKDLDVSGGLISHGETGDAAKLLENFSTEVFSQLMFTGLEEDKISESNILMAPNPATTSNAKLYIENTMVGNLRIQISDIVGKSVRNQIVGANEKVVDLEIAQPGMYLISVYNGTQLLKTEKLLVR